MREESFRERVYAVVRMIPSGKVMTYGDVAGAIGSKAYRAVGQVLKRNPHPLHKTDDSTAMVPCHRVVGANGKIGGFGGSVVGDEILLKKLLLKREGITIRQGVIQDFSKKRFFP